MLIPDRDKYSVPLNDVDSAFVGKNNVNSFTHPLMVYFSPSFFGQIVKVWYVLRVFVMHDAWNSREGKSIDFPIKILPKPTKIRIFEPTMVMKDNVEVQEHETAELAFDHLD